MSASAPEVPGIDCAGKKPEKSNRSAPLPPHHVVKMEEGWKIDLTMLRNGGIAVQRAGLHFQ